MQTLLVKIRSDGIWISVDRERNIVKQLYQNLSSCGFDSVVQNSDNFGYPYIYARNNLQINCRLVDSVFFTDSDLWTKESAVIITDNHPICSVPGRMISVLPEFWSVWHFVPNYIDRPTSTGYNCFMNRPRGDRSMVFYELIKRNLLTQGFVSYNCDHDLYQKEFIRAELDVYQQQHDLGQKLMPYNTVESHGTLEQCIIDSNISLILETYTSDSHIVFSEKIFRALQLPRPWLLYCSPGSIALLKNYGFDVLDDYVDIGYDSIAEHSHRLLKILDQLETFIDRKYTEQDYQRFDLAAQHNQALLSKFEQHWPEKFNTILNEIKKL
jgi:hypothetical protein